MNAWSARRVIYTSVAKQKVNLLFKHLLKAKSIPFPAYEVLKSLALQAAR